MRIDKWLWGVRICKTRKVASELCKQHKVLVLGQPVKASREVMPGQVVIVKRDGVEWQYKVIQCLDKRVSAPLSLEYKEDITPKETLERLKLIKMDLMPRRPKGSGRPTKKERRNLEKLTNNVTACIRDVDG
ncbi:MAG: RNA-binding S4 domain-containing protein [Candidatus Omnitrophica bacterium]|nr:RNA-binding S4 domain-containing protein [Candidatus Omnitrophota bacterium]MBU4333207.1 RNA-binding S4 domain-containing protein [Candidatus Omnitrophota bacterium]